MASKQTVNPTARTNSLLRCDRALEDLLTNRGKPSHDVDLVLADDPQFIRGHCLRAAIIVRADDIAARFKLVESVMALETMCPDVGDPARRHAASARAWLRRYHCRANPLRRRIAARRQYRLPETHTAGDLEPVLIGSHVRFRS